VPEGNWIVVTAEGDPKLTVTVNDACAVKLKLSVAVHVTVVVPSGNSEPEDGVQVGPLTIGVVEKETAGANETMAPEGEVDSTVMSSILVMVIVRLAMFLQQVELMTLDMEEELHMEILTTMDVWISLLQI